MEFGFKQAYAYTAHVTKLTVEEECRFHINRALYSAEGGTVSWLHNHSALV